MIMRKETLVFLTSLAIIFIIGYINMTMVPKNALNEEDYAQFEEEFQAEIMDNDLAQNEQDKEPKGADLVEVIEMTDTTDIAANQPAEETAAANEEGKGAVDKAEDVTESTNNIKDETAIAEIPEEEPDFVILGDITNILDDKSLTASSNGVLDMLNSNFANFKLSKEKGNLDVIDHLEKNLSNESISDDTKNQFEALLLNKNQFIQTEKDVELMLQSKGYNETVVIVDEDMIKVVTNDTIEQADATKILDVIVSETNYEPEQIKIVKFDNIDL